MSYLREKKGSVLIVRRENVGSEWECGSVEERNEGGLECQSYYRVLRHVPPLVNVYTETVLSSGGRE